MKLLPNSMQQLILQLNNSDLADYVENLKYLGEAIKYIVKLQDF